MRCFGPWIRGRGGVCESISPGLAITWCGITPGRRTSFMNCSQIPTYRSRSPTLTLSLPPSFYMIPPSLQQYLKHAWPCHTPGWTTLPPYHGAHARPLQPTWWLQNPSTSAHFTPDNFIEPFSFYHPRKENCMADDASCLFELSDTSFLTRISVVYPDLPPLLELRS